MTNVARRFVVGVAIVLGAGAVAGCTANGGSRVSSDDSLLQEVEISGGVWASRDAALLLADSKGGPTFGRLDNDGLRLGRATAEPKSQLMHALEARSGAWLAVTGTCYFDSGNPCGEQVLHRVSSDLETAEAVSLGTVDSADPLLVRAVSDSGAFVVSSRNDHLIRLGIVSPAAQEVDWFWKSEPYDLKAIMDAANASQNFEAHPSPRVDVCSSGDRFIWRYNLAPDTTQGWEIESATDKQTAVWVPSVDDMGTFACTQDTFVSYGSRATGGPITRNSAAIPAKGAPATQDHTIVAAAFDVWGVGDLDVRANGSLVAQVNDPEEIVNPTGGTTRATGTPTSPGTQGSEPQPTTVPSADEPPVLNLPPATLIYWPPGAPQADTMFDGSFNGRHIVTDEGELIGWRTGNRVRPAD